MAVDNDHNCECSVCAERYKTVQPSDRTPDPEVIAFYYVKGAEIYKRPVRTIRGVEMGFRVCTVTQDVDPEAVCAILNRGEPAT